MYLVQEMRRLGLVAACSALLLSGTGIARADVVAPQAPGSLAVSNGAGTLAVHGGGVIFGVVGQGSLILVSYRPGALSGTPAVSGATARMEDGGVVYSGTDIRFLLPEGRYSIQASGSGIDLSAVGRGSISVSAVATGGGTNLPPDGSVALDGASTVSFATFVSPGLFAPHAVST